MKFGKFKIRFSFLLTVVVMQGCLPQKKADPIVIPPGQLVEYTNEVFLGISGEHYTVDLQKLDIGAKKFFSVEDLTPKEAKAERQDVSFIIPKDKNSGGIFIVKVSLPRAGMSLQAIVLPDRKVKPSIPTTLASMLFEKYPSKNLSELSIEEVDQIEKAVEKSMVQIKTDLNFYGEGIDSKQWFRFVLNYVARDPEFLSVAEDFGYNFIVNSEGMPSAAPYPFGQSNALPVLDAGNSTPEERPVNGREDEELEIAGKVLDPDADFVLSQWFLEGNLSSTTGARFKWTPGYLESRDEPYKVSLRVTDGGVPTTFNWDAQIYDKNRRPELTSTCELLVREWEKWTCTVSAKDYDGDSINFTVLDKNTFARVLVDGQQTDDITRMLKVMGKESVTIEITPDNRDAKKRSAPIEVLIDDGKMGQIFVPLSVVVEDINSTPVMKLVNGSMIIPFIDGDVAREWDYCANADPDGLPPYRFMIEVYDPDNLPEAMPRSQHPDIVDVSFGGNLKSALSLIDESNGCPATTQERAYFCFEWKPKSVPRSGSLNLSLKDDHGGVTVIPSADYPDPIVLTSEDRNVKPCLDGNSINEILTENQSRRSDSFDVTDEDIDPPWPELAEVPFEVMPLLQATNSSGFWVPMVFKTTFFNPNEWISRFAKNMGTISSGVYRANYQLPNAGGVVFSRTSSFATPVVIPQGFRVKTNTPTQLFQFETATSVTLEPEDKDIWVPVVAVNRTVPVGKLNRWISAPAPPASVSNPSALTANGTVSVTRFSVVGEYILPAAVQLGTSEIVDGSDTVRYETVDNVKFLAGEATKIVRVRRQVLSIASNTVTVSVSGALSGPPLSVNNPVPLIDKNAYSLSRELQTGVTLGQDRFCWKRRGADSSIIPASEELEPFGAAALEPGMEFFPDAGLGLEGYVKIRRSNPAAAITIPEGYQLRSGNATRFQTSENLNISAGSSVALIRVRRVSHTSPEVGNETSCVGWSDLNFLPNFLSTDPVKVQEGSHLLDFEIKVTDNVIDPTDPRDYLDRHVFTVTPPFVPPVGQYRICRNPGDNPANIDSPACVPCTTQGSTYFESASCFIRYIPALQDVSEKFNFKVEVNDNGMTYPANSNLNSLDHTIVVVENNDPPQFTDSAWNPISNSTLNSVILPPTTVADLGDYTEGVESNPYIFMIDSDKGADLKNLNAPTVVRVWREPTSGNWTFEAKPSGMATFLNGASSPNSNGWGSKTVAVVRWKPNDAEVKKYAAGGVLELEVCDKGTADSPKKCTVGFYKFRTINVNNQPTLGGNLLTMEANKYINQQMVISDPDFSQNPVEVGSFYTRLSMCTAPDVYSCAANLQGWPLALSQVNETYEGNVSVAACRAGAGLSVAKHPQLVMESSPLGEVSATHRTYRYRFQWCPQITHIGTHNVFFDLLDNGDEDYRGAVWAQPRFVRRLSMQIKVVAPVFFEGPRPISNSNIQAQIWPKNAFTLSPYYLPLVINNSRGNNLTVKLLNRGRINNNPATVVGNAQLRVWNYSNLATPVASHPSQITNFNPQNQLIALVWTPYKAPVPPSTSTTIPFVSNPLNQLDWPEFTIEARDQTLTTEFNQVSFRVQVKDPLATANQKPVIVSTSPTSNSFSWKEEAELTFSVTATDDPEDFLSYRWYLNDRIVSTSGSTYKYVPAMNDAFLPVTSPGRHKVRVEVSDGSDSGAPVSRTWEIAIRNTAPMPEIMNYRGTTTAWNFIDAVKARVSGLTVSNLIWGPFLGISTRATNPTRNELVFSGGYTKSSVPRNYIMRIPFENAGTTMNAAVSNNLADNINWSGSRKSQHIGYREDISSGTISKLRVSGAPFPSSGFSSTSDAVELPTNLNGITGVINSTYSCVGPCVSSLFTNQAPPGAEYGRLDSFVSQSMNPVASLSISGLTYTFYAGEFSRRLEFLRLGTSPTTIKSYSGNDVIASVAINSNLKRLYVAVRDISIRKNVIEVYDVSDPGNGVPLLSSIVVNNSVNPLDPPLDHRILDMLVDHNKNRLYAFLPGTGELMFLDDKIEEAPDEGDLRFAGKGEIGSSLNDILGEGRKLVFDSQRELLLGVSKGSQEIFIVDTQFDAFTSPGDGGIRVFRTPVEFHEVLVFGSDGMMLGINKSQNQAQIYYIR